MKHYIPLEMRYLIFSIGAGWLMLNFLSRQEVRYLADYQELLTNKMAAVVAVLLCVVAFMASDAAWKRRSRNDGAGGYDGADYDKTKRSVDLDATGDSGGGD
ncbi:hypothetical protein [Marinobacter alkaliphilus]|jgi:hypothetical protein|uniref:Uncharacterized protein n=1 Tax=Marinobacter alkaliphilus TaxID=254719 RepID=A0ABZ3E2L8_9GAMM